VRARREHGEERHVVGTEPIRRHPVEERQRLGDAPLLAVAGDDRGPHRDVPLRRGREHAVRVPGAAALEVHVNERAVGEDVAAHVALDRDAVHAAAVAQRGQPRARAQHRRERELVRRQPFRPHRVEQLHRPLLRLRAAAARAPGDHGVPRDDAPLRHSVEQLLRAAEVPDLDIEDKQLGGDVRAAAEAGGHHARVDPLAEPHVPPVHAFLQQKRVGSSAGAHGTPAQQAHGLGQVPGDAQGLQRSCQASRAHG